MDLNLRNRTALVGGASEGLGLASAIELADLGANIILVSRNEEKLIRAIAQLNNTDGQSHRYIMADYSKPGVAVRTITEEVQEPVHILVNNSGGPPAGPVAELDTNDYLKGFEMHFRTSHDLVKHFLPGMKESGFGRIVNILSISVQQPIDELPVSNMIRAGIASWSKTLSNEVARNGITVNNVLPGYTMTSRMEYVFGERAKLSGQSMEEVTSSITNQIPSGRFASPAEIGAVVAFLCTPAASYITGSNVPVDGGFIKGNH